MARIAPANTAAALVRITAASGLGSEGGAVLHPCLPLKLLSTGILVLVSTFVAARDPIWLPINVGPDGALSIDVNNMKHQNGSATFWQKSTWAKDQKSINVYPEFQFRAVVTKSTIYCAAEEMSSDYQVAYADEETAKTVWSGPISAVRHPIIPGSVGDLMKAQVCVSSAKTDSVPKVPNYLKPIDPTAKNRQGAL